jgi:hypothetical protein
LATSIHEARSRSAVLERPSVCLPVIISFFSLFCCCSSFSSLVFLWSCPLAPGVVSLQLLLLYDILQKMFYALGLATRTNSFDLTVSRVSTFEQWFPVHPPVQYSICPLCGTIWPHLWNSVVLNWVCFCLPSLEIGCHFQVMILVVHHSSNNP